MKKPLIAALAVFVILAAPVATAVTVLWLSDSYVVGNDRICIYKGAGRTATRVVDKVYRCSDTITI